MTIQGTYTALVTPFKGEKVDEDKLKELIEVQIGAGIDGIVPCGTTGESPSLNDDEHKRVVEITVRAAANRVPVIGGAGSNDTAVAVEYARHCEEVGCDAILSITPYYNKPTQAGLFAHFKTQAEATKLPVVLYNVPGRTGCSIDPETVAALDKECENIAGLKDATGNIVYTMQCQRLTSDRFALLAGNDDIVHPLMAVGGQGVISVVSNLVPDRMKAVTAAFLAGDMAESLRRHLDLLPLCKALFMETNPIPIKTAMGLTGKCSGELRLPLVSMAEENKKRLKAVLLENGLL